MTQPIKFRAWDEDSKEMFRVVMIGFGWPRGEKDMVSGRGGTTDSAILMQFTGLLDKNGKEIYCGDIVKAGESLLEVVWSEDDWGWTLKFVKKWNPKVDIDESGLEVIGNIYENPELLK